MTNLQTGTNEFFTAVVNSVEPVDTYQGLKVYNICHIIDALVDAGMTEWGIYGIDLDYREMLVDVAVDMLDAIVYGYPKHQCQYLEGVELAIHNGKRAFVLEDLS